MHFFRSAFKLILSSFGHFVTKYFQRFHNEFDLFLSDENFWKRGAESHFVKLESWGISKFQHLAQIMNYELIMIRNRPSQLCETQIFTEYLSIWIFRLWYEWAGGKCLVDNYCGNFWWKMFGGKFVRKMFGENILVENVGGKFGRKYHIWYTWGPCFSKI